MGKTENIKKRAVWIYLPSIEQRTNWELLAGREGMSFSKWVINNVEENLENRAEKGKNRRMLEQENSDLKSELSSLQKKLRDVKTIKENLERDIRKYRSSPFLQPGFEGKRSYDKELIDTLKNAKRADGKNRFLSNDEILTRLGVDITEVETVKGISRQLSRLEGYELVRSSPKGWKWKG